MTLTPLAYAAPMYYKHSGRFSVPGAVAAVIVSSIAAIVMGGIYSFVDLHNPCISVVTFALTAGFGAGIGGVTGWSLRWGRVRNEAMVALLATLVALVGLYSSWIFWVYFVLDQGKNGSPITPMDLVIHPEGFWHLIVRISEQGVWSIGSSTASHGNNAVSGLPLWVVWFVEAALVVGLAIYFAFLLGSAVPYCEKCSRWTRGREGIFTRTGVTSLEELRRRLEAKDLGYLLNLPPAQGAQWLRADLYGCDGCNALHILTVNLVRRVLDNKGNASEKVTPVVNRMIVSANEVVQLTTPVAPPEEEVMSSDPGAEATPVEPMPADPFPPLGLDETEWPPRSS